MILLAPQRAMGGIQSWASSVEQAWPEDIQILDTSPLLREPSQGLSPLVALLGLATGCRVWFRALSLARRSRESVWATTAPSIGFRIRDVPFLLIAKWLNVTVVLHVHGSLMRGLLGEGSVARRWAVVGLRAAHAVVVLDAATQRELASVTGRKIARLPNFISPATSSAAPNAPARAFLYVGRVSRDKGSDVLLELGARLGRDQSLIVVGPVSPDIEGEFTPQAREAGLVLKGRLAPGEVLEEMLAADVLVLPSHHEGFPMVVLEAMSVGLPVLAADVGACREMLEEGCEPAAGAVLPSPQSIGDAPYVDRTLELASDADALRGMLGGPRRVRERYSTEVVVPLMRRLLEERL